MLISRVKTDDDSDANSKSSNTASRKTKTPTKQPALDEKLSANSSIDEEIVLSQSFHQFLAELETRISVSSGKPIATRTAESIQYAKVVVAFVAQKVQLFVQLLPNTLVSILLVLMVVASKVVIFQILVIFQKFGSLR